LGDRLRLRAEPARAPLGRQPLAQLEVALGRLEDPADDELRRRRAVPGVLLEAEGDVVVAHTAEAVELGAEPERDRRTGRPPRVADAEAQVLAVADRGQIGELAAGDEQGDAWVAETERREAAELRAELERERRAGDDRVDDRHRPQIVLGEVLVRVGGERGRERVDVLGPDREPGGRAMAPEALEVLGAGGEPGVEVEGGDAAAAALPGVASRCRPGVGGSAA